MSRHGHKLRSAQSDCSHFSLSYECIYRADCSAVYAMWMVCLVFELCVYAALASIGMFIWNSEFNTLAHCAVVSGSYSQLCDRHSTAQLNNEWIRNRAFSQLPASNESTTTSEFAFLHSFPTASFSSKTFLRIIFWRSERIFSIYCSLVCWTIFELFEFLIAIFCVTTLISAWVVVCNVFLVCRI